MYNHLFKPFHTIKIIIKLHSEKIPTYMLLNLLRNELLFSNCNNSTCLSSNIRYILIKLIFQNNNFISKFEDFIKFS